MWFDLLILGAWLVYLYLVAVLGFCSWVGCCRFCIALAVFVLGLAVVGLRVCCLFCCVGWVLLFEVKRVAGVWFDCGRFALSLLFM